MSNDAKVQVFVQYAEPAEPGERGPLGRAGVEERLEQQRERLGDLAARPGVLDARPIFTRPARTLLEEQAGLEGAGATALPDLSRWIRIRCSDSDAAAALETTLAQRSDVAGATRPTYLGKLGWVQWCKSRARQAGKSAAVPVHRLMIRKLERQAASASERENAGQKMPDDISARQRYMLSAPWGLGVVDVPGWPRVNQVGDGIRVGVIDDYWNKSHPDLSDVPVAGETGVCCDIKDHGTNAVGILLASEKNGKGLVGLAAGAELVFAYPYSEAGNPLYSVADAINRASELLRPGDVLLIERQIKYRPVELAAVCFDAIQHAIAKGIVVIEPAGNGEKNLDDLDHTGGVDLMARDSGAIMVGAGLEGSPQKLGMTHTPAYKSCYGRRVDLQAFGANVLTTTGLGRFGAKMRGLWGRMKGSAEEDPAEGKADEAFTDGFNGTSSASAIVAGGMAVACSVAKALDPKKLPLSPATLRRLAIETGSPQSLANPATRGRHVGPQPNLPALLRGIRKELYERNQMPQPRGEEPDLTRDELELVRLVSSGLAHDDVAALMKDRLGLDEPAVQKVWSDTAEKLQADTPLAMARAADHWGLI